MGSKFEFDPSKSASNKQKHGIDFNSAQQLWNDPFLVELKSRPGLEERFLAIGMIDGHIWTAIFTQRNTENESSFRIISVRRARENERKLYYANN